jgi:hypothetical protein
MEIKAATREENILYLLHELDQALRRRPPKWTPHRAEIAKRMAATVALTLAEMVDSL